MIAAVILNTVGLLAIGFFVMRHQQTLAEWKRQKKEEDAKKEKLREQMEKEDAQLLSLLRWNGEEQRSGMSDEH